jgi:hypothetical protein
MPGVLHPSSFQRRDLLLQPGLDPIFGWFAGKLLASSARTVYDEDVTIHYFRAHSNFSGGESSAGLLMGISK